MQNMALSADFAPSASSKTVSFIGHDTKGQMTPFRLQTKSEDLAKEVVDKMKAEVEDLKKA